MPWQPGQSGNPEGGRLKARRFANMLDRAITQDELKPEENQRLRMAIEKVLSKASEGDLASIQLLAERLDGKAVQPISGEEGGPVVVQILRHANDPDPA